MVIIIGIGTNPKSPLYLIILLYFINIAILLFYHIKYKFFSIFNKDKYQELMLEEELDKPQGELIFKYIPEKLDLYL